jgi:hypothetical protein
MRRGRHHRPSTARRRRPTDASLDAHWLGSDRLAGRGRQGHGPVASRADIGEPVWIRDNSIDVLAGQSVALLTVRVPRRSGEMAVAAFCLAGLLMPFFYQSGEEIRINDRVTTAGVLSVPCAWASRRASTRRMLTISQGKINFPTLIDAMTANRFRQVGGARPMGRRS